MRSWWLAAALVCASQLAQAERDTAGGPWNAGVSFEMQARADALYAQANDLFAQQAYAQALTAYGAALAIWDHPLFRFNEAVVLLRLERVVEAADSLERALRFGAAPFTPEVYGQALQYQKLVESNVGKLEASCTQVGAQVLLDGKPWFQCPGTQTRRVSLGDHTLYAELPRFVALSHHVTVGARTISHVDVTLVPIEQAFEEQRRFPVWVPWTVLGTGVAAAFGGLLLELSGQSKVNEYDQQVATRCAVNGCSAEELAEIKPLLDSGQFRSNLGIASIVAGGGLVIGGFVMLMLNRPTPRLRAEFRTAGGGVSASATWSF